jgi:hypothetical protein
MGPGLVTRIPVCAHRLLPLNEEVQLQPASGTLALDGERHIEIFDEQTIKVRLTGQGPRVVDIELCMEDATRRGVFQQLAEVEKRM